MSMLSMCRWFALIWLTVIVNVHSFRVLQSGESVPKDVYFRPYDKGFTGTYGDPTLFQRERINEGAFESADQELLYEGVSPRQSCPGMVGPFSDGNYYCTAKEYGYCDKRSGTCFCNTGYQGIDCSECQDSHYLLGNLCYPKKLCKNDCNGAGTCNYNNGTCNCLPHRSGSQCETLLCTIHSPLCEACTKDDCLRCKAGYYLTGNKDVACSTCYDFDPRCAGCTSELGCTTCADSTLTSVRRSGYRSSDPPLPLEENSREFSITLPFGTKSPESFADAENYFVCTTPAKPLKNYSSTCSQGLNDDESWSCSPFPESHVVCGHYGVFSFKYPNFQVNETTNDIRMYVRRSGGGYGNVTISYYIKHFTTNDSDLIATASYTTLQQLNFDDGVIERSFKISILDDNIVEENEVFQVVLEVPEGGGSVGAQFRANVTIVDNDLPLISAKLSKMLQNTTSTIAGVPFSVYVQAVAANGMPITMGGERFLGLIENDVRAWSKAPSGSQRNYLRVPCNITGLGTGIYKVTSSIGIPTQGTYQLRLWHAFPRAFKGEYFYDAFFDKLAVSRLDHNVNFTWGTGRLIPRGRDYITVRWSGAILTEGTGLYSFYVDANDHARLWVDGDLLIDHWHENGAYLEPSRSVSLQGGSLYEVVLEYREVTGTAHARLMWSVPSASGKISMKVIPQKNLYSLFEVDRSPVIVTVLSNRTEASTTECTGDGLFDATARHQSTFSVCPRDSFRNMRDDFSAEFLGSSQIISSSLILMDDLGYDGVGAEVITPLLEFNPNTFCFDASYTPFIAGKYQLNITYSDWHFTAPRHVAGSPFTVEVVPDKTSGPKSLVTGLNSLNTGGVLVAEAGLCYYFNVTTRDDAQNYRMQGGDQIEVYAFRVNEYAARKGNAGPTSINSNFGFASLSGSDSYISDAPFNMDVVRFGTVKDWNNGQYGLQICPVIAGLYEIHILLGATGVSNQHFTIQNRAASRDVGLGGGSFSGDYIASSPYAMVVSHTVASAYTSTATGQGLKYALTGLNASFTVTVRDPWDNILRDGTYAPKVTAKLNRIPTTNFTVTNIGNGTYTFVYTPTLAGANYLSIYVNGFQIRKSPFALQVFTSLSDFLDATQESSQDLTTGRRLQKAAAGSASAVYSYVSGDGLIKGTTGQTAYFQLFAFDSFNNRITTNTDSFVFNVSGDSFETSSSFPLVACPKPPQPTHPICDPFDTREGHYFGEYTPFTSGILTLSVYIQLGSSGSHLSYVELMKSPHKPFIYPSDPNAELSDVTGEVYDNTAGVTSYVYIQLRDYFGNKLTSGGNRLELALLGVAGPYGTTEPFYPFEGIPNSLYYKGFYSGSPNTYGSVLDNRDGSYKIAYSASSAGLYVMRLSLAESGLNVTLFNGTTLGHLTDLYDSESSFAVANLGKANNLGSTVSWTGDVGGTAGARGDLGVGSYFGKYLTSNEGNIDFDMRGVTTDSVIGNSDHKRFKFRDEYWSARFTGMITPMFAERYEFSVVVDGDSSVLMILGGVGNEFNQSQPGDVVIDYHASHQITKGEYFFTDTLSREIVLEYVHFTGDAQLTLYWRSPSTPFSVVPAAAFSHWRNISEYNTTIHPARLCPHCSTAVGDALNNAVVAVKKSFVVYARDEFGNLLQKGGDVPGMFAVGNHAIDFRGTVTDYGNSTYLIEYYPTRSGVFNMYITIGCCLANPAVGYPASIQLSRSLLIKGSPFQLTVLPAAVDTSRTVATGTGLVGGMVGDLHVFTIYFRDIHDNPTTIAEENLNDFNVLLEFRDKISMNLLQPTTLDIRILPGNVTVYYNITRAAQYWMHVNISQIKTKKIIQQNNLRNITQTEILPIISSPFSIYLAPTVAAYPNHTVCQGLGLRNVTHNRSATFKVILHDIYRNKLTVGGNKFFMRLIGDVSAETPVCSDSQNGAYRCSYTPRNSGFHHLVIRLLLVDALNSNSRGPGGSGLLASYFSSVDGALVPQEASGHRTSLVANVVRVDPVISFSWSDGLIMPFFQSGDVQQAVRSRSSGQSIRWEGYMVSPRTDLFTLSALATGINVTIFCDDKVVFDSFANISVPVSMIVDTAYALKVFASIWPCASEETASAVKIALQWSTTIIRKYTIPAYFLYPLAAEVAYSPFPVTVT